MTAKDVKGAVVLVELPTGIHQVYIPKNKTPEVLLAIQKALEVNALQIDETPMEGVEFKWEKD